MIHRVSRPRRAIVAELKLRAGKFSGRGGAQEVFRKTGAVEFTGNRGVINAAMRVEGAIAFSQRVGNGA